MLALMRTWICASILFGASIETLADDSDRRPFSSRDAVEMSYFGNIAGSELYRPYDDGSVSPDGRSAIKISHRGVLPEGVTEGVLWLFDVENTLQAIHDTDIDLSAPVALARVSAAANGYSTDFANFGNTLLQPKWSSDGQSVYFLGRDGQENRQLFRVDVLSREISVLSPPNRDVFAYAVAGTDVAFLAGSDIRSDDVWRIEDPGAEDVSIATGTALNPLLFPNFREYANVEPLALEVWRVKGDEAEPVTSAGDNIPVTAISGFGAENITLSPNGQQAVVVMSHESSSSSPGDQGSGYRVIDLEAGGYEDIPDSADLNLSWTPFAPETRDNASRLRLTVKEDTNRPPVLVATDRKTGKSREVFDPNPQLSGVELLPVEIIEWEDKHGGKASGGLIKPLGYAAGTRYPLVIQTHGFKQYRFFCVGFAETANAGRALASRGFVVLQVQEPVTRPEAPLDLEAAGMDAYLAAIDLLDAEGMIDPKRVGISGYSFTGLTAAVSIARAPDRFKAAVIANADPLTLTGYYSYLDSPLEGLTEEFLVGASPVGEGLNTWIEKSPSLSADSIEAAVLVAATDPFHLLSLWDFYAGLRYQGKNVELQFIRSGKHNLMKPLHRLAHQELIVDWFEFWLKHQECEIDDTPCSFRDWRQIRRGAAQR